MRCFLVLIITDERSLAIWTWLCLVRRLFYRYFVYRKLKRVVNNHTDSKEILFTWCYRKPLIEKIKAKRWIDVFNWILIAVFVSQYFFFCLVSQEYFFCPYYYGLNYPLRLLIATFCQWWKARGYGSWVFCWFLSGLLLFYDCLSLEMCEISAT